MSSSSESDQQPEPQSDTKDNRLPDIVPILSFKKGSRNEKSDIVAVTSAVRVDSKKTKRKYTVTQKKIEQNQEATITSVLSCKPRSDPSISVRRTLRNFKSFIDARTS